jgi:hypothetical protein
VQAQQHAVQQLLNFALYAPLLFLQGEPLDAAGGEQPLALHSQPLSVTCAAKISRHQLVGFTWKAAGFDSVWQVRGHSQHVALRGHTSMTCLAGSGRAVAGR